MGGLKKKTGDDTVKSAEEERRANLLK